MTSIRGDDARDSTVVTAPAVLIAGIFDDRVEALAAECGMDKSRVAIVGTGQMDATSWNIGAGDIVMAFDPLKTKNSGKYLMYGHGGRVPVVGQVAGVPFSKTPVTIMGKDEEAVQQIKNQRTLRNFRFVGVAESGFDNTKAGGTPKTNGFQVVVWGQTTVKVPMTKAIPPMTPVVIAIDPGPGNSQYNRVTSSAYGADRHQFTIKAYDPRAVVPKARTAIANYHNTLSHHRSSPNFNPSSVVTGNMNGSAVYSEDDVHGATLTHGGFAMAMGIIDILIRSGRASFNATPATRGTATEANAAAWRAQAPGILGFVPGATAEDRDLMLDIINVVYLGNLPARGSGAASSDAQFRMLVKSCLQLFSNGFLDMNDAHNRIAGMNVGEYKGRRTSRLPTGYTQTDVIWGAG